MDKLDSLLLEAWDRISAKLRRKRLSAFRRSRRRFKKVLTTPMRESCLVIRASDTRINDYRAAIEAVPPLPVGEGRGEGIEQWASKNLIESHQPHIVTLDGRLIRDLTKPVKIPWPGVTYAQAADICGREYNTIQHWVAAGVFKVDHYRERGFPEFNKRSKPRDKTGEVDPRGSGGRPYVWTPSPIDPNNFEGRTPHPIWGTLWQWMWQDFPENYQLTVTRVPRMRGPSNSLFTGWEFLCPGRLVSAKDSQRFSPQRHGDTEKRNEGEEAHTLSFGRQRTPDLQSSADGEGRGEGAAANRFVHIPCGRRCMYLYGPMTVTTLAKALGEGDAEGEGGGGFDMPEDSAPPRLAGQWFPGLSDPIPRPRSFACKECWGVRPTRAASRQGWNDFITQISGGLLYGREVPRPPDIFPMKRRKPLWKKRRSDWKGWAEMEQREAGDADAIASSG
jgi:hypothetical protein